VTSSTALALNAGGSNQNVNLVPTGTGTVNVSSKRITGVATPTAAADAATKAYVDAAGGPSGLPTMISAEPGGTYTVAGAQAYCRSLNAACARTSKDVACDATAYADWRLPTAEELGIFLGITGASTNYLWTRSVNYGSINNFVYYRLDVGSWTNAGYTSNYYVRCVR
jgi:hypothetical protein